jgi:hypothetical protein
MQEMFDYLLALPRLSRKNSQLLRLDRAGRSWVAAEKDRSRLRRKSSAYRFLSVRSVEAISPTREISP